MLITFIKIGGSLIAPKEKKEHFRPRLVKRIAQEIKAYQQKKSPQELLLIGHGAGSFGHQPAKKYAVMAGQQNSRSLWGMALTQDAVARLQRLVVKQFLQAKIASVSLPMSASAFIIDFQKEKVDLQSLIHYWQIGLLPITYGDVIGAQQQGWTIWSTEKIFSMIIKHLPTTHIPQRIIHLTNVPGVLNRQGQTIKHIGSAQSYLNKIQKETSGADVTGGMYHKIAISLQLAQKKQLTSFIIDGRQPGNLLACLENKKYLGTQIG